MIFLNEEDMRKATSYEELMTAIEESFYLFTNGECKMAERFTVTSDSNTMLYMPCFAGGYIGTKMLAEWPGNPEQGLPYLDGMMILNNEVNGKVEAVMKGDVLTALRTGAVGGVAIRHLSEPDVGTVGLVGCGVQGLHQLCYACTTRDIQTIYLYNSPQKDLSQFIENLLRMIAPKKVRCIVCEDVDTLVEASQVIITATQANEPVLPNDSKKLEGKLIVAIGSWKPTMKEIPDAIWKVAKEVYTELPYACEESGDLYQPLKSGILQKEQVKYMGEYLQEKKSGKVRELGKTRFYKSVGMGVFDTMVAQQIYRSALEKGLGQKVVW